MAEKNSYPAELVQTLQDNPHIEKVWIDEEAEPGERNWYFNKGPVSGEYAGQIYKQLEGKKLKEVSAAQILK